MFQFAYPLFFLLLIPAALWLAAALRKKPDAATFSAATQLAEIAGKGAETRARIPLVLRAAALVLLVLAIARPQTVDTEREVNTPGVDIVLCLDASDSMRALDFKIDGEPVTRLTAVKKVVRDFIKKREFDRIGIVVFGTHAFTQAPLTLDKGLLLSLVDKMETGMAGPRTAIGDALAIAGKRIKDIPAMSKVVVLLSDGKNTSGELATADAASALAALGIKIHAIAVGSNGPAPVGVPGFFGARTIMQTFETDEAALQEIADIGQGRFFHAQNTDQLAAIYNEIDKMEKTDAKVKEFFHFKEHFRWFLGAALVLLLIEISGLAGRAIP